MIDLFDFSGDFGGTEPESLAPQKERSRGLTMSKRIGVLVLVALLVVAGCAKPAPCAPHGGVLNLDRPDCRLPAAEVLK